MTIYYIIFIVLLTLAELIFTLLYYFFTGSFDLVVITGLLIYAGCVVTVSLNYQIEAYQVERRELLDGLLHE